MRRRPPWPFRKECRRAVQFAQLHQQLGIQQRRARRAANGVVREHGELPVQQSAGAQAADGGGHARPAHAIWIRTRSAHAVEARLRPIFGGEKFDRLRRCCRKLMLRKRPEFAPGGQHLLTRRRCAQLDRDALGVAVFDGNAVAVRAHACRIGTNRSAIERAEQLHRLGLHLFLFIADEGDNIAQDVERWHARIARSADGLHGADEDAVDAEAIGERLEREHQSNGGAVRIGDDVSAGLLTPALLLEQRQMGGVHLGDDQRNVFLHAEGAGVRDDSAAGGGKLRLELAGDIGVERGEDDRRRLLRAWLARAAGRAPLRECGVSSFQRTASS